MSIQILVLTLSAFAIGTTEFVIMGLLPEVARDLAVSIPSAGLLVTGYALGVTVGAPLLSLLTSRLPRVLTLKLLLVLFIAGNALCALAPGYALLMVARVVASLAHGAFFGIGAVVASSIAAPERRASAIALMFSGLTLANVLGVPLGTLVGQTWGWRLTFWGVSGLGVLALLSMAAVLPECPSTARAGLAQELRVLKEPKVWMALAMTVLSFGGVFTVFTYIAPILQQVSGFSPQQVSAILVLLGLGMTLGNLVGGKLADRAPLRALQGTLACIAVILLAFGETSHHSLASVATVFAWGVAAFALITPLQAQVVSQASSAPNLASTLNIAAFNLGNAAGAWLGSVFIAGGWGLDRLPWLAAALAVLALGFTRWVAAQEGTARPASAGPSSVSG